VTRPIRLAADNPMMMVVRANLIFEVVANGLSIPVMTQVSHIPAGPAAIAGGTAAGLSLISVGVIRRVWGWVIAWLAQVAGLALGLLTPGMFLVGGMFALLFVVTFILGRRLESGRAETGPLSG